MQISEYIQKVCEEIKYKPIRKEIGEELTSHLNEIKETCIQDGMEEQAANQYAIEQMGEATTIGKSLNKVHKTKFDWKLVVLMIVMLVFGFLANVLRITEAHENVIVYRNIIAIFIGVLIGTGIYFFDYKKLMKYTYLIYGIAIGIILFGLIFGVLINGVKHIYISTLITFIPNVLSTPLFIIAFIGMMNQFDFTKTRNHIKLIVLSAFSIYITLRIPSFAAGMILFIIYTIVSFIKISKMEPTLKKKCFQTFGIVMILAIMFIGLLSLHAPYRVKALLMPFAVNTNNISQSDQTGIGWLAMQRKEILQEAKLFGKMETEIEVSSFMKEEANYSILLILMEYGYMVTAILICTVLLLSLKLILNAKNIKDTYGKYLTIGLGSLFIIQSILNVLINLNLWSEITIRMPFVSFGNIELITYIACMALILSIYRRKDIQIKEELVIT